MRSLKHRLSVVGNRSRQVFHDLTQVSIPGPRWLRYTNVRQDYDNKKKEDSRKQGARNEKEKW